MGGKMKLRREKGIFEGANVLARIEPFSVRGDSWTEKQENIKLSISLRKKSFANVLFVEDVK